MLAHSTPVARRPRRLGKIPDQHVSSGATHSIEPIVARLPISSVKLRWPPPPNQSRKPHQKPSTRRVTPLNSRNG
jgi:hypothetical protein